MGMYLDLHRRVFNIVVEVEYPSAESLAWAHTNSDRPPSCSSLRNDHNASVPIKQSLITRVRSRSISSSASNFKISISLFSNSSAQFPRPGQIDARVQPRDDSIHRTHDAPLSHLRHSSALSFPLAHHIYEPRISSMATQQPPRPFSPHAQKLKSAAEVRAHFARVLVQTHQIPSPEAHDLVKPWKYGTGNEVSTFDAETYRGIFGPEVGMLLYQTQFRKAENGGAFMYRMFPFPLLISAGGGPD